MPDVGTIGGGIFSLIGADRQADAAEDAAAAQERAALANIQIQRDIFEQTREDQRPWRETGTRALNELALRTLGPQRANTSTPGIYDPRIGLPTDREEMADRAAAVLGQPLPSGAGEFLRPFSQAAPAFQRFGEAAPKPEDIGNDPGYQFRMSEGMKALERSAAARGGLLSGGTLRGLTRYSQGVAADEYQNAYSRYNDRFNRFHREQGDEYGRYTDAFNRQQIDQTNRFNRLSNLAGVGQTAVNQLQQAGQNYANQASRENSEAGNARAAGAIGAGNAWAGAFQNLGNIFSRGFTGSGS